MGWGRLRAAVVLFVSALGLMSAQATAGNLKAFLDNTDFHKTQYYLQPGIYDGRCATPRPMAGEAPLQYADRYQQKWPEFTADVDCILKYYSPAKLRNFANQGDLVAFWIGGLTDKAFLADPCRSEFRTSLDKRLSELDGKRTYPGLIYSLDMNYAAGRIEENCANPNGAFKYYYSTIVINDSYFAMYYKSFSAKFPMVRSSQH